MVKIGQKVVVVTGGSDGIGRATVEVLETLGFSVWNFDIKSDGRAKTLTTDVSSSMQIKKSLEVVLQEETQISGVFANAGIVKIGNIESTTTEEIEEIFRINYMGVVNMMQESFQFLRDSRGSFVVCSSDQTFTAKPMTAIYGSLKAAVSQLVKTAAITEGPLGVRVNAVAPGPIRTSMHMEVLRLLSERDGLSSDEIEQKWATEVPLGRIGNPTDVANLVAFLLDDKSSFINGAIIPIDGGLTAGIALPNSNQ